MPYVLLTTYREAKECTEILAGQDPQNCPVFTMVVCDETVNSQHRRATKWAARLSEPIFTCNGMPCPHTLVRGLMAKLTAFLTRTNHAPMLLPNLEQNARPQWTACDIPNEGSSSSSQLSEEHDFDDDIVAHVMQACRDSCSSPAQMEQIVLDSVPEAGVVPIPFTNRQPSLRQQVLPANEAP